MLLVDAIQSYLIYAQVRRLSPDTIRDYSNTFRKFVSHMGNNPPLEEITPADVGGFLLCQDHLSKKTVLNYHVGLSALWTWAIEVACLKTDHVIHRVPRPRPEKPDILPYTTDEFLRMLASLKRSAVYTRPGKRASTHSTTRYAKRNRAILFMLYDTGVRSSELCNANIDDLNFENRRLHVLGKGTVNRHVRFSRTTSKVLQNYLKGRKSGPIFLAGTEPRAMARDELLKMIYRVADRAGVGDANVHRFRHTFALEFLRNGGRPLHLKALLGHATMSMVDRYVLLAQTDLDSEHEIASPIENLSRKKALPTYSRLHKTR